MSADKYSDETVEMIQQRMREELRRAEGHARLVPVEKPVGEEVNGFSFGLLPIDQEPIQKLIAFAEKQLNMPVQSVTVEQAREDFSFVIVKFGARAKVAG